MSSPQQSSGRSGVMTTCIPINVDSDTPLSELRHNQRRHPTLQPTTNGAGDMQCRARFAPRLIHRQFTLVVLKVRDLGEIRRKSLALSTTIAQHMKDCCKGAYRENEVLKRRELLVQFINP